MIDKDGYRPNVGIIICNQNGQVLWARRHSQHSWQFPQGGIKQNEAPEQAMYRELYEEVGLTPKDVKILAVTNGWLRYKLPKRMIRWENVPVCIGQKQKWFLLQLISEDAAVKLDTNPLPEFDDWRWVNYWYPIRQVIAFKREVYRRAMKEFAPLVFAIQSSDQQQSMTETAKNQSKSHARPSNRQKRRMHYYQAKRQPKKV